MLSTFPAMFSSSDGVFGTPFPAFEGGFTPWDCQEPPFVFPHYDEHEPVLCPVEFETNSGSDNTNPLPVDSNSGSDQPNRKRKKKSMSMSGSGSGSDDTNTNPLILSEQEQAQAPPHAREDCSSVVDERKRRRMISNRESARRSRMRKQKHLENLRNQVNRLRVGNRELTNRVRLVTHHYQLVRNENEQLRSESVILRQRLWDIRQVLLVRQLHQQQQLTASAWPRNNFTSINEETIPQSLIT